MNKFLTRGIFGLWNNKYLISIFIVLNLIGYKRKEHQFGYYYFHIMMQEQYVSGFNQLNNKSNTSNGYPTGKINGQTESTNNPMTNEFFSRELKLGMDASRKTYDFDEFENGNVIASPLQTIKKHIQTPPIQNLNSKKFLKLLCERNKLNTDNILLKSEIEDFQSKYKLKINQLNAIKKQRESEKITNDQTIQKLSFQLKTANQKIENLQNQIKQKNQQIKSQHDALHGALILPFEKQDNRQLKFEDLITSVKQLGQQLKAKTESHKFERQFVSEDFEKIINNFKQIEVEDFTFPKFQPNKVSFFSKISESLTRNRLEKENKFKIPSYYHQIIELMNLVDEKNEKILSDWKGKLNAAQEDIKRLEDGIKRLQKELVQKQKQYKDFQIEYDRMKKELEDKITILQKEINRLMRRIKQLQGSISQLKSEIEKLEKDSQAEVAGVNENLRAKQAQLSSKKQVFIKLNGDIAKLNKTIEKLNGTIKQHQATITKQNNQIKQLKQKISSLQNQLRDERLNGSANSNKADEALRRFERTKIQLQQKITDIQNLNSKIQGQKKQVQRNLTVKNQQLRDKQKQNDELKQIQKKMENHITELQMKPKFIRCYEQYFNGKILNYQNPKQTELFVGHIEAEMGRSIIATKILYRDDRYNTNSYHNYVDGVPNIVLLVTHSGGQIIGGFSEAAYHSKNFNCDFKKGLMLEFTNGRVFHTKQKKENGKGNKMISRPLSYDEFYIIWGNSDLRIKPPTPQARDTDLELHSFYGTANSCYEERGNPNSSIEELFSTKNRNLTFEGFQMFEVIFE